MSFSCMIPTEMTRSDEFIESSHVLGLPATRTEDKSGQGFPLLEAINRVPTVSGGKTANEPATVCSNCPLLGMGVCWGGVDPKVVFPNARFVNTALVCIYVP